MPVTEQVSIAQRRPVVQSDIEEQAEPCPPGWHVLAAPALPETQRLLRHSAGAVQVVPVGASGVTHVPASQTPVPQSELWLHFPPLALAAQVLFG